MEEKYMTKLLNFSSDIICNAKELLITKEQAKGIIKELEQDYISKAVMRLEIEKLEELSHYCALKNIDREDNTFGEFVVVIQKVRNYINQLETKVKELKIENENLIKIQEEGLNRESQHCFYEDGNTGKCLGYGDDEPCEYCKTCERLSIKEND